MTSYEHLAMDLLKQTLLTTRGKTFATLKDWRTRGSISMQTEETELISCDLNALLLNYVMKA